MYLLTLEEWISEVLVRALGLTFTHSLWQSLIALLVAYVMLALMKKAKATARYNMLLAVCTLLLIAVTVTFLLQLRQNEIAEQTSGSHPSLQKILYDENSVATPVILESKRILDVVLKYFNQHMALLVAVWFVIFCVKWLRLSLNLSYVNRISRFESAAVSEEWQHFNDKLKNGLGISRQVQLLQSNIVKVPLVSGIFKPLILVPAGMLSNMPVDVIESILLHELAHIKRNDYLVNFIQSAIETVFFFNPFVIKLSALIREEREACCDAIAVDSTQNKVSYVQALVMFGEYSSTSAPLLAFAGSKNHLLQRVKRILYNQNKKPGFMEKSILLSSLVMLTVITAFTSIRNEKKPVAPVLGEVRTYVTDTVPDNVNENEEVNINETENANQPSKAESRKRQKTMRDAEKKVQRKQEELEKVQQKLQDLQIHLDNNVQINNEQLKKQLIELQTKINLENQKIQLDVQPQLQITQLEQAMKDIDMEKINRDVRKALKAVDMEKINREAQAATLKAMEDKKMVEGLTITSGNMNDDVASILEFLERNDVADAKDVKSFTLNNEELTVNGKKEAATLHQQLKERYIHDKDDHIIYSNSNGRKSITITRNDAN